MSRTAHFDPSLFVFLRLLDRNNNREWFQRHKRRYEAEVRDPMLRFIADFAPRLARISSRFVADRRPVGGSMFRVYRDTRFSRDKRPYKTFAAAQFRHEKGKDVHAPAPGFYLHLQPGECFAGVGLWHPDGETLRLVRDHIVEKPDKWRRAVQGKAFAGRFELAGDRLKRAPRGYDPAHRWIEDLKRKDYIGVARFEEGDVTSPDFLNRFAATAREATTFMRFLIDAIGLRW